MAEQRGCLLSDQVENQKGTKEGVNKKHHNSSNSLVCVNPKVRNVVFKILGVEWKGEGNGNFLQKPKDLDLLNCINTIFHLYMHLPTQAWVLVWQ